MDPINDILSQKADDLFPLDQKTLVPSTSKKEETKNEIDLAKLKLMLHEVKDQIEAILRFIGGEQIKINVKPDDELKTLETGEKIIEGVFNGEKMIGPDGHEYSIPPNYASKSKLVEGDLMKLTITNNGSFIFKQIKPIERKRLIGELVKSEDNLWSVLADGRTYKVLTASVTFYKGKSGDEAVVLTPQEGASEWAAVENIIKR